MNNVSKARNMLSALVAAALIGGAAGCSAQTGAGLAASPTASEVTTPLAFICSAPDSGLLDAMTSMATAATSPGSTIELMRPSVVNAGAGRQAFAFSWIGHVGGGGQQGPLNIYVARVGDNTPSDWQEISYDDAIAYPYGDHPGMSQDDQNALIAAHVALGCLMGG